MEKVIYRNVSDRRIDIIVVSNGAEETIGQAYQSSGMKWKLKTYFPVGITDFYMIKEKYDGPIEAGQELVKAWQYYTSLDPFKLHLDEMFAGEFLK